MFDARHCGGFSEGAASAATGSPLTIEDNTGVTFTNNFNPFDSSSFAEQLSVRSLINEPLFEFDTLKANTQYPWLATKYALSNGGKTSPSTLRTGVKWSDGTPFTSADVAYTFNLLNKTPAATTTARPRCQARPRRRTSTRWCCTTRPGVPQHHHHRWCGVDRATRLVVQDQEPGDGGRDQGSRHRTLRAGAATRPRLVKYTANPHYWGGKPAAHEVNVAYYASNTAARRPWPMVSCSGPVTTLRT